MSLYNTLHGFNENARMVLSMLGLETGDCGRFRDAWINEDGETLSIFTRNGGGNREEYQSVMDKLAMLPTYIRDFDDDFDCTYATIEFSVPEKYQDLVKRMKPKVSPPTLLEKTNSAISSIKDLKENGERITEDKVEIIKKALQDALNDEREE